MPNPILIIYNNIYKKETTKKWLGLLTNCTFSLSPSTFSFNQVFGDMR